MRVYRHCFFAYKPVGHLRPRRLRPLPHGFWIQTKYGPEHINGDPRMSDETLDALQQVTEAAYRQFARQHGGEGS